MNELKKKVAAIVVTYNRKDLLLGCIESIKNQSLAPDLIIIVDNASTDGTLQFLNQQRVADGENIKILELNENVGGAGGFCVGISTAMDLGFDWVWLMDDDGYAEIGCLEKLLHGAIEENLAAISPLVVEIEKKKSSAFPFAYRGLNFNLEKIRSLSFIPREAHLFNGFLASREVFLKIGLPRREFFIRGDEVEFCYRMLKNSIRFGTYTSAIFYHPSDAGERFRLLHGLMGARYASSDFKNYYLYRNKAFILRKRSMYWVIPIEMIKYIYFFMVKRKFDFHGLILWLSATKDGVLGRLGKSDKY